MDIDEYYSSNIALLIHKTKGISTRFSNHNYCNDKIPLDSHTPRRRVKVESECRFWGEAEDDILVLAS